MKKNWQWIYFQIIEAVHAPQYQKNTQPNQIWGEDINRQLSKGNMQMANKHMKRCSTLLIFRNMQIKTMRYHLTPVRMAVIKQFTKNKSWRKCRKGEPSCNVSGNANWYSHYGGQYGDSLKN